MTGKTSEVSGPFTPTHGLREGPARSPPGRSDARLLASGHGGASKSTICFLLWALRASKQRPADISENKTKPQTHKKPPSFLFNTGHDLPARAAARSWGLGGPNLGGPVFRGQRPQGLLSRAQSTLAIQGGSSPRQAGEVHGFPRLLGVSPSPFGRVIPWALLSAS